MQELLVPGKQPLHQLVAARLQISHIRANLQAGVQVALSTGTEVGVSSLERGPTCTILLYAEPLDEKEQTHPHISPRFVLHGG